MEPELVETVRCAIYTRKSGDNGLGQEVNSLDAQREMCAAYIKCNAHRGWRELPRRYDDGGYSGGSLDRPALTRLLGDVHAGKIDVIVVYKIDRLTRSLGDFVRVMERVPASFVSVTQAFDTSDTMGRLILNILLTFAQFEREMVTDRIRDKLRTMKEQGLFVNFMPPLGYDKVAGRLVINQAEAHIVRDIFKRFETAPNAYQLLQQLRLENVRTKSRVSKGVLRGGVLVGPSSFYKMLKNPLYAGLVVQDGELIPGGHEAIIDRQAWDMTQERHATLTAGRTKKESSRYLLRGFINDENGRRLIADTSNDGPYRKRYYQTQTRELRRGRLLNRVRVRAPQLEDLVMASIVSFLADPVRVRSSLIEMEEFSVKDRSFTDRCVEASRHARELSRVDWRRFLELLLVDGEVAPTGVRLRLSVATIAEIIRSKIDLAALPLIARDGSSAVTFTIRVNANLTAHTRDFSLPLDHSLQKHPPDRKLVNLLKRAFVAREKVMARRDEPLASIAREMKTTAARLSRILRLTYLAPDIQAAIMDGRQPADLTAHKLTYSPMPLDWAEQRELFGFDTEKI